MFLPLKCSFNASALSPPSVTSVHTWSCNAATSLAPHSLSQEHQKPFQPPAFSAHLLKLLSCWSSCTFSKFMSMQIQPFAESLVGIMDQYIVWSWKKPLQISTRVFQWFKWLKYFLVVYKVLWKTKNAVKLFQNRSKNVSVLLIWKHNNLCYIFKFLFHVVLNKGKNTRLHEYEADMSKWQWFTDSSQRQLL